MDASLETLVVAGYVFATSLSIPRPGPPGLVTDHELIALAVAQAITGLCSDRQFLGQIGRLLPGWFPVLPDQSQYNRRLRRLTPQITQVQMMIAELIAQDPIRLVDGTLIGCANYPGCQRHSEFAGHASFGYCPSKSQYVWGMRLVVICDIDGVPVGYDLVGPKTGEERESALHLAGAHAGSVMFADKGLWGKELDASMELIGCGSSLPNVTGSANARLSRSPKPVSAWLSSPSSRTSNARCASSSTSPKRSPGWSSGSLNACSR